MRVFTSYLLSLEQDGELASVTRDSKICVVFQHSSLAISETEETAMKVPLRTQSAPNPTSDGDIVNLGSILSHAAPI